MAQTDVEVPVPVLIGQLDEVGVARHAHDVDDAVEPAKCRLGLVEQALGIGPAVASPTRPRHDLLGDLAGEPGIDIDAEHLRPDRAEGVRGLRPIPWPAPISTKRRPSRRSRPG